jgi:predicted O-methyltransferase YrrM
MKRAVRVYGAAFAAGIAALAIGLLVTSFAPAFESTVVVSAALFFALVELARARVSVEDRLASVEADLGQIQPLLELTTRLRPRAPLPAMRGYAIAPDCALMLTDLVRQRRPELIVETGSGVSTLVLAYALEKLGRGRVVSLEHDARWADRTRRELERHGLSAFATVIHAPLQPLEIDGERYTWHALAALEGLDAIDLVVDDGPPKYVGRMARYASLPTFASRLRDDGVFLLDVLGREERAILARWRDRHPEFLQEELATRKGNVLLRRAGTSAPLEATPPHTDHDGAHEDVSGGASA